MSMPNVIKTTLPEAKNPRVPDGSVIASVGVRSGTLQEKIGALQLRAARESRGVSLEDLAARTKLDVSDIANIETGTTEPSLGTIWKLSAGLGVPFSELLGPGNAHVSIQRAADAQILRTADGLLESRPLVTSGACRWVEAYALELAPGARHASEPHPRGTREIIVVISGSLSVTFEGCDYILGQGDSISFLADLPHAYENPGNTPGLYHDIIVYDR
jgi:transcriptional regulator with XRE-family HTH domain